MASPNDYLDFQARNGQLWRIWADGRQMVVPRVVDQIKETSDLISARDLAAEFYLAQQQLAQARTLEEDLRQDLHSKDKVIAYWKDDDAKARALLEAFTEHELIGHEGDAGDTQYCVLCGEDAFYPNGKILHSDDCPWLKARAFLSRKE